MSNAKRGMALGLMLSVLSFLGADACSSDDENSTASQSQSPPGSATAKIMPLGDSITASSQGQHSYRFYLWHLALAKGYRIDFVGSQHGVSNGAPADPDFDMDHEGHPGWRADEILAQVKGWATAAAPDFVLLHIGTNDLCQGQSVESTVRDVEGIIDVLRTVNPRIRILLAQVIASANPCHAKIPEFNAELSVVVAATAGRDSPIVLVEQYTGFDPAAMTYEGVHPNEQGEVQMADRWFAQLAPLLDAFFRRIEPVNADLADRR